MNTPEEVKLDAYPNEEEEEKEEHDDKEKEQDDQNLKDKEIDNSVIHLFGHNLKKQYGAKIIIFILYVVIILLCLSLLVLFFKFLYYYTHKEEIPQFEQLHNITLENTSLPKDSTNVTNINNINQVIMPINDKDVKNITQIPIATLTTNERDSKNIIQNPIVLDGKEVKSVTQITFAKNEKESKNIAQLPVTINETDSKNVTQSPIIINRTETESIITAQLPLKINETYSKNKTQLQITINGIVSQNVTQAPFIIKETDSKIVKLVSFRTNETASKNKSKEKVRIKGKNLKSTTNNSKVLNNTLVKRNETNKRNINTIGFLYPKLTNFMISTGEYFIKTGKYKIWFLTESPRKKELKYNPKIKRENAYFNMKSIKTICKKEKIDFLIVNDGLSKEHIKSLKSLNIKLIGIPEDDYSSSYFGGKKKSLYSTKLGLYDAFIQKSIEDYNLYKKLNLTNNIIIQNTFTLLSDRKQASNKTNSNIVMLADLNDKKINISSFLSSMNSIVKMNSATKLYIFSTSKPSKNITQLIEKLKLGKHVVFNSLNYTIFNYFKNCSIFIYASSNEIYQNILSEAKVYGLPCIILYNFKKNIAFNKGVIKLDLFNKEKCAREIIKIMNDKNYNKKIRNETKLSVNIVNKVAEKIWEKLFNSIKNRKKFKELRFEIENNLIKKKYKY